MAALCATPEHRLELTERILAAVALEQAVIAGRSLKRAGGQALMREVADHLRALLRDVICGHLSPELPSVADELLVSQQHEELENDTHLEEDAAAESGLPEPEREPVLF